MCSLCKVSILTQGGNQQFLSRVSIQCVQNARDIVSATPSVCTYNAGTVSKEIEIWSHLFDGLYFCDTSFSNVIAVTKFQREPFSGALHTRENVQFSIEIAVYLGNEKR